MDNKVLIKNINKTALISSPIIAILTITPLYLIVNAQVHLYFLLIFIVSLGTYFAWRIQIFALHIKPISRFLLAFTLLQIIAFFITSFYNLPKQISLNQFHTVRIINITIINLIIYMLIEFQLNNHRKLMLEKENNDLSILNLETQLENLKNQFNPHFLFNSLSTLKSLIKRDTESAERYTVKLAEFLRKGISTKNDLVTIEAEIEFVNEFISLQKIRFGNTIELNNKIEQTIYQNLVPLFCLQSLIENAIKHNYMSIENPLQIEIYNNSDTIIVANKLKRKENIKNQSKSGLVNLNKRMLHLCKSEIKVEIISEIFMVSFKSLKL